ncbi:MAG TPA: PAS domain S-box protein [Holophagaceae bacterium]|nr:PAS domain S-box protein [Holophagaceae bacterium]
MKVLKILLALLIPAMFAKAQAPLRFGVLAFRPKALIQAEWQPMGRHLSSVLGRKVEVTPYDFNELNAAITRNEVDVVLTNPGHYILLKQRNIMSAPLVTRVGLEAGHRLSGFGGVIFTRADEPGIHSLRDLTGRRIAAVGRESLGGYQMQAFELMEAGIPFPGKDELLSVGLPYDRVVEAVLAGRADVGFARSGVLEAMVAEGKLAPGALRIINRQDLSSFPYLVSTRLHPEWPVTVLPQVDSALADQLAIALLSLPKESDAARSAGLYGFTTPSDYTGVEQMLRSLRVPPFDAVPHFTLADLWHSYQRWITAFALLLLTLAGLTMRLVVQNRHIQQSEARYSTILNNVDACIYLKDSKGRYLFANQRALDLWGLSLKEVLHQSDDQFFDPPTVVRIQEVDRQVLVEGRTIRTEEINTLRGTDQTFIYWSVKLPLHRPDGSIHALCGISTDITGRKQAEEAMAYLAAIVESSDDAIVGKSLEGVITSWNQAAVRMFGYAPDEAIGQSVRILFPPDRMEEEPRILESVRSGRSIEHLETVRIRKDGSPLEVAITISPIRNAGGEIIGASKVIRDITDLKRVERALKDSLAFSDQIISSAQQSIVVYDLEGRIVRINKYLEELSGYTSAELAGKHPEEAFPFVVTKEGGDGIQAALTGRRVTNPPFRWEFQRTGRSGWGTAVQGPLLGARGEIIGAISVATDITDLRKSEEAQRKLEADLQQTQKLESLGSLAGGIAHDMNNVLGAIQAMSQTLKLIHAQDPNLVKALDTIEVASNRGRDLVKGLTNFARKDLREPEPLDLNALLREEMEILRRTTLQKVTLALELDPMGPCVHGERSSLASAIMNLCVNAVDAMPDGGALTLRTRCVGNDHVELTVADSGQGMPPEVLARAMEPFFTTKPVGKGTGLGLAMVYTTVKAHGGTVDIQSKPGRGTAVTLRLPTIPIPESPGGGAEAPAGRSEILDILQVDDDPLILESVPCMIEALGHRVTTANGGRAALERLAGGLKVDFVILDLNMPAMNGEETLRELRKTHPRLPVLLATGFLDARTEAILRLDPQVRSLSKPFSMAELEAKIREMARLG